MLRAQEIKWLSKTAQLMPKVIEVSCKGHLNTSSKTLRPRRSSLRRKLTALSYPFSSSAAILKSTTSRSWTCLSLHHRIYMSVKISKKEYMLKVSRRRLLVITVTWFSSSKKAAKTGMLEQLPWIVRAQGPTRSWRPSSRANPWVILESGTWRPQDSTSSTWPVLKGPRTQIQSENG